VRLLVIIPAYNEQVALKGLLEELHAVEKLEGVHIEAVVIDDGSADLTAEVARAGQVRVLRLCANVGIGGAVQSGIRLAHREGFDAALQLDGDGQHPPAEIAKLVHEARGASAPDIVVGTRFRNKDNFRSTVLRRLGSWWLRTLLRVITRVRVTDPTSGYRLYGKRALRLFGDSYPYDFPEPESLAIARARGMTIVEVPVQMRERQGGTTSITGFSPIYYMFKVTIAVVLTYVRALGKKRKDDAANS
jgi:glycosyltransferase involved in cell wall biosynthesis